MNRSLRGACKTSMCTLLSVLLGKFILDVIELGIGILDERLEGFGIHLAGLFVRLVKLLDCLFNLFFLGVGAIDDAGGIRLGVGLDALCLAIRRIDDLFGGALSGNERVRNRGRIIFLLGKLALEFCDALVSSPSAESG